MGGLIFVLLLNDTLDCMQKHWRNEFNVSSGLCSFHGGEVRASSRGI